MSKSKKKHRSKSVRLEPQGPQAKALRQLGVRVGERLARGRLHAEPGERHTDLADETVRVVEERLPRGVEDELHRVILADQGSITGSAAPRRSVWAAKTTSASQISPKAPAWARLKGSP